MVSDICTNPCKIFRNLQIRVAQNRKTLVLQVLIPYHICRLTRITAQEIWGLCVKVFSNVVVVVLNYVFSKLIIFKKK